MSPAIVAELMPVVQLDCSLQESMFALLEANFVNVSWVRFIRDLLAKQMVILLREPKTGKLLGFSTQVVLKSASGARVVFSGDTIVVPEAWGSLELPRAWGRWMLSLQREDPKADLYWLLISKGHRTYRLLSDFFSDYAPGSQRGFTERESLLLEEIGGKLFQGMLGKNSRGHLVVRAQADSQALRPHLRRLRPAKTMNPRIAWFLEANPNYEFGEELVCLTRFSLHNSTPFYRGLLGAPRSASIAEGELTPR